jgi:hypothetical protein
MFSAIGRGAIVPNLDSVTVFANICGSIRSLGHGVRVNKKHRDAAFAAEYDS